MIKLSLDHFISTANARCSLRPCTRAPHDDTTNPISPRLYGETKLQMGDQDDRRLKNIGYEVISRSKVTWDQCVQTTASRIWLLWLLRLDSL
ncbi:hypothetical protein YC2023_043832 [Brassica napus]